MKQAGWASPRLALLALSGVVAALLLLVAISLLMKTESSSAWKEFSIGFATGNSTRIDRNEIRSDGITLKVALAVAYEVPAVRVIGPPWLAETRYSINAVVASESSDSFRPLLQRELKKRLRQETHIEVRPFDVFVLTATAAPRLEPAIDKEPLTWIHEWDAQLRGATMERVAAALQSILGKPVINETGITGSYDLDFEWGENRVDSLTTMVRDRFGLQISAGKRDMEALIIDDIQLDAALAAFAQISRFTGGVPPDLRQRISSMLAIH